MKPSRALYMLTGAAFAAAVHGAFPGPGAFFLFSALLVGAAAITFDWNNA